MEIPLPYFVTSVVSVEQSAFFTEGVYALALHLKFFFFFFFPQEIRETELRHVEKEL